MWGGGGGGTGGSPAFNDRKKGLFILCSAINSVFQSRAALFAM